MYRLRARISGADSEDEAIPESVVVARPPRCSAHDPVDFGDSAYRRRLPRVREVSRIDGSVAVLVGVHCGLGAKAIVLYGNAEQKARYLPMLARGETLAAYALTEPNVGSDAQHVEATAEWDAARNEWVLNGRKIWPAMAPCRRI